MIPFARISTYNNTAFVPTNKIVQIAGGSSHLIVLYSNGELYGLGKSNAYQLNTGSPNSTVTSWRLMDTNVRLVASSEYGTVTVKNDGTIKLVGRKNHVVYNDDTNYTTFSDISSYFSTINIGSIVDIKLSTICIMILLSDGSYYGIGNPIYQQLGGNNTGIVTLTSRTTLPVRKLFASALTTGFITTDNRFLIAGYNSNGATGSGSTGTQQSYAEKISSASVTAVKDAWLTDTFTEVLSYPRSSDDSVLSLYYTGNSDNVALPSLVSSFTLNSSASGILGSFCNAVGRGSRSSFGTGISTGLYSSGFNGANSVRGMNSNVSTPAWDTASIGFETVPVSDIHGICSNGTTITFLWYGYNIYYAGSGTNYGINTSLVFTKLQTPY